MLKVKTLKSVKNVKQIYDTSEDATTKNKVSKIIKDIKTNKDKALFSYIKKHDKWPINKNNCLIKVKSREAKKQIKTVDEATIISIKKAYKNILEFNLKTIEKSYINVENDRITGLYSHSYETIGIYVPGGNYPLISSVLMLGIPARIANTKRIILATKANSKGEVPAEILAACEIVGIDEVYKISGPFAIAAMAFGTDSIPKADKIFGPGNKYVNEAKKQLISDVGIDMIAGPSELLVIADKTSKPKKVAADLLSQAEHDEEAKTILISNSGEVIKNVNKELKELLNELPTKNKTIAKKSIEKYGRAFKVSTFNNCLELANIIAAEHVSIQTKEANEIEFNLFGHQKLSSNNFKKVMAPILEKLNNAGAIFLGHSTPEAVGDYFAGPNHTLPTNGSARWASALSINDFLKRSNIYYYTKERLLVDSYDIMNLATVEDLVAHKNSVLLRTSSPKKKKIKS